MAEAESTYDRRPRWTNLLYKIFQVLRNNQRTQGDGSSKYALGDTCVLAPPMCRAVAPCLVPGMNVPWTTPPPSRPARCMPLFGEGRVSLAACCCPTGGVGGTETYSSLSPFLAYDCFARHRSNGSAPVCCSVSTPPLIRKCAYVL